MERENGKQIRQNVTGNVDDKRNGNERNGKANLMK